MNKQVNFAKDFKPNFSGHETFSLRYGWLEKSFQAIVNNKDNPFIKDDAIAQFGVGKNMVNAIKQSSRAFSRGMERVIPAESAPSGRIQRAFVLTPASSKTCLSRTPEYSILWIIPWVYWQPFS